jgi:hypothetical protein
VLKEVNVYHEVPGLFLTYWEDDDRVTGSIQASHSNQKETRRHHFECGWPDGHTVEVESLTVAGKTEEEWRTETKGIGQTKRADLHVKVRQVATQWRDEKLKEQRLIAERIRQPDTVHLTITDDTWMPNRNKTFHFWLVEGCLVSASALKPSHVLDRWFEVTEIGPVGRTTAEYIAWLRVSHGKYDLATDAAKAGLPLKRIKEIVAAEDDEHKAGERMLREVIGAAPSPKA